jgi:hypothetical protein
VVPAHDAGVLSHRGLQQHGTALAPHVELEHVCESPRFEGARGFNILNFFCCCCCCCCCCFYVI